MKRSIFLAIGLILITIHIFAQENTDWPNMQRFATENKSLNAPVTGENRVVFMGNSITQGWIEKRPEFFKENPYIDRGISGQTTPQMLLRFRQDVIELQPAVVVILAGTNDIAQNTGPISLEDIMANLKSMAELARIHNIRVVLCSVLPAQDYPWRPGMAPDQKIPRLNSMIERYAREEGFVYLDYFREMSNKDNGMKDGLSSDGVHPTVKGYEVMEPMVKKAIAKALK